MTDAELTLDALERMGGKQVSFYVGDGGDDNNSGRSWEDRLRTIGAARKLAWAGDKIRLGEMPEWPSEWQNGG